VTIVPCTSENGHVVMLDGPIRVGACVIVLEPCKVFIHETIAGCSQRPSDIWRWATALFLLIFFTFQVMKKKILLYGAGTAAYFLCVHLIWGLDSDAAMGVSLGIYIAGIIMLNGGLEGSTNYYDNTCPHCKGRLNTNRLQSVCNVCGTKL